MPLGRPGKRATMSPLRQALLLLFLCCTAAAAAPLHTFDFEGDGDAEGWRRKSNTAVSLEAADPFEGKRALRFAIDPAEFAYGWVHSPLPAADFSALAGIHGAFRAPRGTQGVLTLFLCVHTEGADLSYFKGEIARLAESQGRWVEFYLPVAGLRWERGPVRRLSPGALGEQDLVQFLASVEGRQPVPIDVDGVRFLAAADAAPVARRCQEVARARLLLPEEDAGGPPHPRLFFTPERLARTRAKAGTPGEHAAAHARLLAAAEDLLKRFNAEDPLGRLYGYVGDTKLDGVPWRAAFEGELVNASTPIEVLGAAYRLTGDARFGTHAAKALANMAKRLTVDEAFLSRGFYYTRTFYVRALAFGYDWLWDRLTPEERRTVRSTLLGFVTDIHEHSQADGWGRRPLHRVWNWDPGLMGAAGVGMLALEGETRVAEQAILFDCRRHLRDYLTLGIDVDGCGHEGPSYLGYGIGAGVEFAELLRLQGRGDLFTETNYHQIAPWLIAETLPDGKRWNNLSDCGHGQRAWPVYLYACGRLAELARTDPRKAGERWSSPETRAPLGFLQQFVEAPDPKQLSYAALAGLMGWAWRQGPGSHDPSGYDAREALAHVLLYEACAPVADPAALLPLATHFRGRGLVVSRTGFGPEDVHLAIEAGPHAAGHDQCDKGTFTLRAYGADLAIDSGYGNDNDQGKSTSSFAHNVPLIDGEGMPMRYHNNSSGRVTGFRHTPLLDWVRVDAREAWGVRYDDEWRPTATAPVARAERGFVLVRPAAGVPPYLVIHDDLVKDAAEHAYTWQWHIPVGMRFEAGAGVHTALASPVKGDVLTSPAEGPAGSATFRFTVPAAGKYSLYGLVRAGGPDQGKSDSFFVSVDGGPQLTWDLKTGAALWWDAVTDRGEAEARAFDLVAGEHTLTLGVRERQAELARWLVLPAGAPAPMGTDDVPPGAVLLSIADAAMGTPGLIRRPIGAAAGPEVSCDLFPVHPAPGEVKTGWFVTSREGAHPRWQYTVRAKEPRFVVVMVPRREGVPRPVVTPLAGPDGVGVVVRWPNATDTILFSREKAALGQVELDGSAGFVRVREGKVADWALLDGTRLGYAGAELCRSAERGMRVGNAGVVE